MAKAKTYTATEVRRALRKVRTKLLNGKIGAEDFDMRTICDRVRKKGHCGTIGCIGGWAALELVGERRNRHSTAERVFTRLVSPSNPDFSIKLHELFYGFHRSPHYPNIKPKHGAAAITRYLDGKDPWPRRAARTVW